MALRSLHSLRSVGMTAKLLAFQGLAEFTPLGCHLSTGILAACTLCGLKPIRSAWTQSGINFTTIITIRLSCRPEQLKELRSGEICLLGCLPKHRS